MTSYLSSLTSHYTSLKRLLPNSLSPDSDLSCTDPEDSHAARVLRAYYQEKGRVFPPWLGPDPRAPDKSQPAPVAASRYGQPQAGDDDGFRRSNRGSNTPGALDDLFGNGPPPGREPPREQPMRGPRGRMNQPPRERNLPPAPTARPLPSQRQGSNQTPRNFDRGGGGFGDDGPAVAAPSREQTAAERLKARLGGARSTTPEAASAGSYDRAPPRSGGNPYDSGRSDGGRSNPYQGNSSRNPYGSAPSNDRYGGGGGSKPYTAASSPWVSGDDGYGGGGGGAEYGRSNGGGGGYGDSGYGAGGGGGRRTAGGLPSNPRRR